MDNGTLVVVVLDSFLLVEMLLVGFSVVVAEVVLVLVVVVDVLELVLVSLHIPDYAACTQTVVLKYIFQNSC